MYRPLTAAEAADYVSDLALPLFVHGERLEGQDLADGNVNLVYRVFSAERPRERSVIVKQALPYARVVGKSFPMPLDRSRIERRALEIEASYCPSFVPKVYHADAELSLVLIEDLRSHEIMRKGMMRQIIFESFGHDLGIFLARTLFSTSDLGLRAKEKKALVVEFMNPDLCKVTEDLVFTHPLIEHPGNQWNIELDADVRRLRQDAVLGQAVAELKLAFMTRAEALIHGDLHTGSIMVSQKETKIIDPEFSFVGPMAFDIGTLMGNLALSYASQAYHAQTVETRRRYRHWILETMNEIWQTFRHEFLELWLRQGNPEWGWIADPDAYFEALVQDAAGFGGAEMLRRILGLAHVIDLEAIPDVKDRAEVERMAIAVARTWIVNRKDVGGVEDLAAMAEAGADGYSAL